MQPTEKPENNPWRVTSVAALPDFRLRVIFVDGTAGEVDMRAFLSNSKLDETPFEQLRDPSFFSQASVVLAAIQWPNDATLAPKAMYHAIRECGDGVLY